MSGKSFFEDENLLKVFEPVVQLIFTKIDKYTNNIDKLECFIVNMKIIRNLLDLYECEKKDYQNIMGYVYIIPYMYKYHSEEVNFIETNKKIIAFGNNHTIVVNNKEINCKKLDYNPETDYKPLDYTQMPLFSWYKNNICNYESFLREFISVIQKNIKNYKLRELVKEKEKVITVLIESSVYSYIITQFNVEYLITQITQI